MLPKATAVSIANDILFDILLRMPGRALRRFRCVSKQWCALLSDPAFLAAHKSRRPDLLLVDTGYFRGYNEPDLRLRDLSGNVVRVIEGVGGSDILPATSLDAGLVCVLDHPCKGVHVVDLATGKVLLSISGLQVKRQQHEFARCQYETFGIGRTASSCVYKLVRLVRGDTCQVLTLGADTRWRRRKTRPTNKYFLDRYYSPITIDGVMYFLTEGASGTLLCFDLEKEQWKVNPIEGPSEFVGAKRWSTISVYITELNGFLCLVQEEYDNVRMFPNSHNSSTNIWIMQDCGKGNWTKVYTIPMSVFGYRYAPYRCMPLRVMHGGEKLLIDYDPRYYYYMERKASFGLYDPHTKTCTDILPDYLPEKNFLCKLHLEHLASSVNN
jgi:F-box interacting protein